MLIFVTLPILSSHSMSFQFLLCVSFCVVSVFSSFILRQQQQKISQLIWIHHILNNLGNNGNNNTANDDNLHTNGPID